MFEEVLNSFGGLSRNRGVIRGNFVLEIGFKTGLIFEFMQMEVSRDKCGKSNTLDHQTSSKLNFFWRED